MKIVTQQYITRPDGYALVDLYLPQIGLFIEIDEDHHKKETNITRDKIREMDVISVTENQIVRIDVTGNIEDINNRVDKIVNQIQNLINEQQGSFVPWSITEECDPETYTKRGKILLKDNVSFRTCKDACNCFGYRYKKFQRGGTNHPLKGDTLIWFPNSILMENG